LHETPDPKQRQKAVLVGVSLPRMAPWEAEDSLDELSRLVDTAMLVTVDRVLQSRDRIDPAHYIGKGKALEVKALAHDSGADVIVFDNELSPAQLRNLETLIGGRVLDRSAVILDIFARHARTRTSQLQVELAQLHYLLPRLTGQWTHLSRQAGGGAIRGMAGAGVRGPGETQLETDRRMIRRSIRTLDAKLTKIGTQRSVARQQRQDAFKVALVGYTNAGKSTLMRALSGADVLVQDQLFATLDSTTRAVDLGHNRQVLLTDTIGFIKRLPHHLFASFRSTLEDAVDTDLLLHVVDISHPNYEDHIETVNQVLKELELEDYPILLVYNKIDQAEQGPEAVIQNCLERDDTVAVSGMQGIGLDELRERVCRPCLEAAMTLDLQIPQHEGRLLAQLHEQGEVLETRYEDNDVCLKVRLDKVWADRWELERFL
jgi:GTP-binding protein HflX